MIRYGLLTLAVWMAIPGSIAAQSAETLRLVGAVEGRQQPNRKGFDGFTLDELMDETGVPGVSIAVIRDFKIDWAKAYGVADVETGAPVTTETMFQAASISKPVTAMAVLRAVQDGLFSLDGDINSILTSWSLPGDGFTATQPVTPRGLTSHTSGLGDGFGFPGYNPRAPLPTLVQIMDGDRPSNVGAVRLVREPFTAFHYSGGGVTLMQLALTDATQRPFAGLMQEWVLDPIGMSNSTFEQPLSPDRDVHAARAHSSGRAMGPKWHVYPELAAAGLWTTPTDLARFVIEVQRSYRGEANNVLSQASVSEMLNPVGVGDYAVGFSVAKEGQGWYFRHGGSNWGFQCVLIAHKRNGYGLVVMTNGSNGSVITREITERVQRAYGWDALDKPVIR